MRTTGLSRSPRGPCSWGLRVLLALDGLGIGGMRSARSNGAKDPEYLRFIHCFRCIACNRGALIYVLPWAPPSGVQAHHAGTRGLSQKASDRSALPLCLRHHDRGSADSVHTRGKRFWEENGLDKDDLIRRLNELYDSLKAKETA